MTPTTQSLLDDLRRTREADQRVREQRLMGRL